jgi:hypothetical protein
MPAGALVRPDFYVAATAEDAEEMSRAFDHVVSSLSLITPAVGPADGR